MIHGSSNISSHLLAASLNAERDNPETFVQFIEQALAEGIDRLELTIRVNLIK
jgi:hypothetical protein